MEPVKYRTYNSEERAKANAKWREVGATHAQRNIVDSIDLGDCELSRRCGKNYIYRFKNPVGDDPPKLTAVCAINPAVITPKRYPIFLLSLGKLQLRSIPVA